MWGKYQGTGTQIGLYRFVPCLARESKIPIREGSSIFRLVGMRLTSAQHSEFILMMMTTMSMRISEIGKSAFD
jgi:hypothetical protein